MVLVEAILWWGMYVLFVVLVGGAVVLSIVGILAVVGAVVFRRRRGPTTADRSRSVAIDE